MTKTHLRQACREAVCERAAILEFDAGLSAERAAQVAMYEMRVYQVVGQDQYLVLPGVELAEAQVIAERIHGPVTLQRLEAWQWM